ncbi:alpha/beta hydrolase [Sphingosinicellaceae bacterium]|nr:alpha/beta hydrolase [Sphingosinicellaceae bacterium]
MRKLSILTAVALTGCAMPTTPSAKDAARDRLARSSYAAPGGLQVSMLSRGNPEDRRVIFVHGTPGSAVGWEHYVRSPEPGTEAIAIDRPGFGATRPGEALVSLKTQAAAIAPLLVERGGSWPILVGHSLGGPIIAQVAADNPGKVGGLLILAGAFDPGLEKINPMQPIGEWPLVRALLPARFRNANRELLGLKPQLVALAPRLANLRCRVTIIHGTKDDLVPYANVAFLRSHLTGVAALTVETIEGQNHFIVWNQESRVEAALAGLLAAPSPTC